MTGVLLVINILVFFIISIGILSIAMTFVYRKNRKSGALNLCDDRINTKTQIRL